MPVTYRHHLESLLFIGAPRLYWQRIWLISYILVTYIRGQKWWHTKTNTLSPKQVSVEYGAQRNPLPPWGNNGLRWIVEKIFRPIVQSSHHLGEFLEQSCRWRWLVIFLKKHVSKGDAIGAVFGQLARWLDNWTIGQNLNSIGIDGTNDNNLIILYIIIYNIINIYINIFFFVLTSTKKKLFVQLSNCPIFDSTLFRGKTASTMRLLTE